MAEDQKDYAGISQQRKTALRNLGNSILSRCGNYSKVPDSQGGLDEQTDYMVQDLNTIIEQAADLRDRIRYIG